MPVSSVLYIGKSSVVAAGHSSSSAGGRDHAGCPLAAVDPMSFLTEGIAPPVSSGQRRERHLSASSVLDYLIT